MKDYTHQPNQPDSELSPIPETSKEESSSPAATSSANPHSLRSRGFFLGAATLVSLSAVVAAFALFLPASVVAATPSTSSVHEETEAGPTNKPDLPVTSKPEPLTEAAAYPQVLQLSGYEIVKHEPQFEEWKDQKLIRGRMAISMQKQGDDEPLRYVSIEFEADAIVDQGQVRMGARRITRWVFVDDLSEKEQSDFKKILVSATDLQSPVTMPLDKFTTNIARSKDMAKNADVNLSPPPIFYSDKPAVLVAFMGEPDFKAVDAKTNKVLFALNTNWDLLMDVSSSTYYLLIGDGWIKTKNLDGDRWKIVQTLPASFAALPDDDNWKDVKQALNAKPFEIVPRVFISKQPGELIETQGAPEMSPVSGTALLYVKNTESDVFFYPSDTQYYYLVEGRWFRSPQLSGPWKSATFDLPEEFAKIPKDPKKSDVLASVAGTDEAERAAIRAAIPQTATVKRSETTLEVIYDGEPQFELIKGSQDVHYAVNTDNDVFYSNSRYYSCYQGVWFESGYPTGPWDVCDEVSPDIYTIPASAPQHNVTYVRVYNSTPSTVQVGYTSGYSGQYLINNLLVFGAGYWLGYHGSHHHHYYRHWYRPSYVGWGCGSRWSWRYHGYYRSNYWGYGPYGGCVRPTLYRSGHYYRPYHRYGHYRSGYHRPAYSPWRSPVVRKSVAHRPRSRPIPYSHWKNKGVSIDDRLARKHYKRPVTRPGQYPGIGKPSKRPSQGISQRPVQLPAYRPVLRPSKKPVVRPGVRPIPGVKPGKKPRTRPSVKPMPGYKPGKKPSLRPSVKPVPEPGYKPGKKPTVRPGVKPRHEYNPGKKPSARPSVKPVPQPGGKPGKKPNVRPGVKPRHESEYKPGKRPSTRPSVKPIPQPGKKPSVRPGVKPRHESGYKPDKNPSTRPSVKPVPSRKPVYRPTPKPSYKPVPRPTPKPKAKYKPAPKPKYKPIPRSTYRPTPKPKYKPAPRPTYRPSPKPKYKPAPRSTYRPTPKAKYKPTARPTYRPAPKPAYNPTPRPTYRPAPTATGPAKGSSHSKKYRRR